MMSITKLLGVSLLLTIGGSLLLSQARSEVPRDLRVISRKLENRLAWALIWRREPFTNREPTGPVRMELALGDGFVAYCSQEVGQCEKLEYRDYQLGFVIQSQSCCSDSGTAQAIRSFLSVPNRVGKPVGESHRTVGELAGRVRLVQWSHQFEMRRDELLVTWGRHRSERLEILREQLREELTSHRDPDLPAPRRVSVACFRTDDPFVFVYREWTTQRPTVAALRWMPMFEEFVSAWFTEADVEVAKYKTTIEALQCFAIEAEK